VDDGISYVDCDLRLHKVMVALLLDSAVVRNSGIALDSLSAALFLISSVTLRFSCGTDIFNALFTSADFDGNEEVGKKTSELVLEFESDITLKFSLVKDEGEKDISYTDILNWIKTSKIVSSAVRRKW